MKYWTSLLNKIALIYRNKTVAPNYIKMQSTRMLRLHVRDVQSEERMQMWFYHCPTWTESDSEGSFETDNDSRQLIAPNGVATGNVPRMDKVRLYNLNRLKSEELGKSLARISANVTKYAGAKKKRSKKTQAGNVGEEDYSVKEVVVCLFKDGQEVDNGIVNGEAWNEGVVMKVGDLSYRVVVNAPNIRSVKLPECIMSGFLQFPQLDGEFINLEKCQFTWYTGEIMEDNDMDTSSASSGNAKDANVHIEWEEAHKGLYFLPGNNHIGKKIRLVCTPGNEKMIGDEICVVSTSKISAGPGYCPFETRHLYTKDTTNNGSFRIMTYNILADFYADSDYSRTVLFPYCPPYALSMDYRKHLLCKEIVGYNSDIICLQEVDRKIFMNELQPLLENSGFDGQLKTKMKETPEGCATFYRKSKFRLLGHHDLDITTALMEDVLHKDLLEKISRKEAFKEKVLQRSSVMQVTVLESLEDPNNILIVATTHLYFHPRAPHVRLIQTTVCMRHLETVVRQYTTESLEPTLIFCGDLNTAPVHGVVQLLTENRVPAQHADFYAGGTEELVTDLELSQNFQFTSACGMPTYTNYVGGFIGCLDYIFIEREKLKVKMVVPMPSHEEVTQFTALPNAVFPSDHLALICDLEWSNKK